MANPLDPTPSLADLRQKVRVEERLKAISSQLIEAHRQRQPDLVEAYARQAGISIDGQSLRLLFVKTIQVFHPDRFRVIWDQIDQAFRENDQRALAALVQLLRYHPRSGAARSRPEYEEDEYEEEEEWASGFDPEDQAFDEDYSGDFDDEPEGTFYSVVKRELFGNLDLSLDPSDLGKLEGELDLSDYDLHDLGGIEWCRGLTGLNLSRNNLDNVYPLRGLVKLEALDLAENDLEDADALGSLVNLKELDLSANEIDDVAFLGRLPNLRYVDLSGNPVRNKAVLDGLEARGVIVIF